MTPERWQQIKSVLGEALEQRPADRATFLDRVCGDNLSLRSEVESLIPYEEAGETFMDSLVGYLKGEQAPLLSTLSQSANLESDESPDEIDRRIGPYKIVSELGR